MKKVVIYLRVSSSEQSVENQLPALEQWVSSRGHELVDIYQEAESARRNGHQMELARLRDHARRRKFDIVLVWALDRLSREGAAAILNLVNTFKVYGVQVISY
jgi:putative DNA-invertase from lambdoid prophage Rac